MLQHDWIIGNSLSKVSRFFPHIAQSVLLVFLQGYFKKTDIQFKCNNVLRNKDGEYLEIFRPSPEHTVKSQLSLSKAYNNNDLLLLPLQIWKEPHWIKCPDQFTINKRDNDCFEHLHEENTKLSVLNLLIDLRVFMVLTEEGRGVTEL